MAVSSQMAYELARAIAHAAWLLRRQVARRLARPDSEWRLLGILAECGGLNGNGVQPTQAELSAMLGLSPSAFTRLVDRAAARGLVRRVAGVSRRARSLVLTRKGRSAWQRLTRDIRGMLPDVFDNVRAEEARIALAVMQQLSRNLQNGQERT